MDLRKICIANIFAYLGLTFIAGLHFVPDSIVASISGLLIGPILATLDAGSLNLIFKLPSQQQQQKSRNCSLLQKYLFASRGWGNILLGAIFALVLLLSRLHYNETLTRNSSITENGSFNMTILIFQFFKLCFINLIIQVDLVICDR
jgi:hypothetical protein